MAIERMEEMMEEAPEMAEAESISQIPLSLLGGQTVAPGDVVRLEVVDVDEDGGMVNVRYSKPEETKALGADALAAEFD